MFICQEKEGRRNIVRPLISSQHHRQTEPNRCAVPKFDSKILIAGHPLRARGSCGGAREAAYLFSRVYVFKYIYIYIFMFLFLFFGSTLQICCRWFIYEPVVHISTSGPLFPSGGGGSILHLQV